VKLWIDQDMCTGDGRCEEICPSRFVLIDGLAHVRDGSGAASAAQGAISATDVEPDFLDAVIDAIEDCPGECIFVDT